MVSLLNGFTSNSFMLIYSQFLLANANDNRAHVDFFAGFIYRGMEKNSTDSPAY